MFFGVAIMRPACKTRFMGPVSWRPMNLVIYISNSDSGCDWYRTDTIMAEVFCRLSVPGYILLHYCFTQTQAGCVIQVLYKHFKCFCILLLSRSSNGWICYFNNFLHRINANSIIYGIIPATWIVKKDHADELSRSHYSKWALTIPGTLKAGEDWHILVLPAYAMLCYQNLFLQFGHHFRLAKSTISIGFAQGVVRLGN